MMDRRNVLIGLLGVAAAAGLTGAMALRGTAARRATIGVDAPGDGQSAQVTLRVEGMY